MKTDTKAKSNKLLIEFSILVSGGSDMNKKVELDEKK